MTVGEKIRSIRKEKGLTQKQVAERCGMADSAIRKYELGTVTPKLETLQRIASALETPTIDLLGPYEGTPLPNLVDGNKMDEVARRDAVEAVTQQLKGFTVFDGRFKFKEASQDGEKITVTFELDEDAMSMEELESLLNTLNETVTQGVSVESFSKAAAEVARVITERDNKNRQS